MICKNCHFQKMPRTDFDRLPAWQIRAAQLAASRAFHRASGSMFEKALPAHIAACRVTNGVYQPWTDGEKIGLNNTSLFLLRGKYRKYSDQYNECLRIGSIYQRGVEEREREELQRSAAARFAAPRASFTKAWSKIRAGLQRRADEELRRRYEDFV